jgi:cystathionine beta-lyase
MTHVEATYLAWLDVRELDHADAAQACLGAGVALSPGAAFGDPGFLRLNFACPRSTLQEALRRLQVALG